MRTAVLLALLATATCAGCGVGVVPSAVPPTSALHGGILVPLPEQKGFVELLNDKMEKRYGVYETTIVAYLLQPDQKTPLQPKPTNVSIKLDTAKGQKSIPLVEKPDTADPAGSARFVSDFGPFELNQRGGELSFALDGKSQTVPFRGPR
jgi:hypothetical protein